MQVSLAMFSAHPARNRDRLETGEDKQISVPDYDARYLSGYGWLQGHFVVGVTSNRHLPIHSSANSLYPPAEGRGE